MEKRVSRGCLFCRSGREKSVIQVLKPLYPDIRAIVPVKTRYRREGGVAREETVTLLPGYVFFEAEELPPARQLLRFDDVLRLLTYADGDWRLHGSDDQFARVLFRTEGRIGLSRAYYDEGNRVRITEGFLKEYEGSIIRVNRRARTAEVSIDFQDKRVSMWLGFELIERADPSGDGPEKGFHS